MTGPPRSYSGRRDRIAEKLEPYFHISAMLPKNTRPSSEAAEEFWDNSLWCSWGDRETGYTRSVTVSIYQAADGECEADGVREMMREECPPGLDFRTPNPEAYEITGPRPGEYVFVLNYLPRLTAIVGNCVTDIMPRGIGIELSKLADVALDIGRNIGCSAYENDFTLPEVPEECATSRWDGPRRDSLRTYRDSQARTTLARSDRRAAALTGLAFSRYAQHRGRLPCRRRWRHGHGVHRHAAL
jgi:hypothetical protein